MIKIAEQQFTKDLVLPLVLKLPFLTAGLNGNEGLIRQSHWDAGKVKTGLHFQLLTQRPKGFKKIDFPVMLTYVRYCSKYMDWDNASASFKHIGDALQSAGILSDDSPAIIQEFIPRQIKCKRKEQRTEIIISAIQLSS